SGDGKLTTDFSSVGSGRHDEAKAVAIQGHDGRIVVAGASHPTSGPTSFSSSFISLARYHAYVCGMKNVTILGTNGPDTRIGTDSADVILGLAGNDTIDGRGGNDTLCGGSGNDTIRGGSGNDTLFGGTESDVVGNTARD